MKEKKKIFPSGIHPIKDFLVGQSQPANSSANYFIPSKLHTIKDFLIGQNHQEGSSMGLQHTQHQSYFPQQVTHHRLLRSSKLPRRLLRGSPIHSSTNHSPQWIFHQGLLCKSENTKKLCTYPLGIKYPSTDPVQDKRESTELMHISSRIEHASIDPIQVRRKST